ncbi:MAG: lytic transglycosylase domain-containing protein, partial [Candidatus Dormibacteria bacterium]
MVVSIDSILGPPPDLSSEALSKLDKENGFPDGTMSKVMHVESGGNDSAVSPKKAVGAFQIEPATAANPGYGLKPGSTHDPKFAASYLKKMVQLSDGSMEGGLAKYNAGPSGNPNNPETKAYVKKTALNKQSGPSSIESLLGPKPQQEQKPEPLSPLVKTMNPASTESSSSGLGALARSAERSLIPTTAAVAGFGPGFAAGSVAGAFTGPFVPIASPVLGMLGGIASSYGSSIIATALQNRLLQAMPEEFRDWIGQSIKQQKADEEQHALLTMTGEVVPQALFGKMGKPKLLSTLAGAAIGGVSESVRELTSGEKQDLKKIGIAATAGAAFQKPTKLAENIPGSVPEGHPNLGDKAYAQALNDRMHTQVNQIEAEKTKQYQALKENPLLQANTYQRDKEDIYSAWDEGKSASLKTPEAKAVSKTIVAPLHKEVSDLVSKIASYGVDVGEQLKHYMPRIPESQSSGSIFSAFDVTNPSQQGRNFSTWAREFQDRNAVSLTSDKGWRSIAVRDPEKGTVTVWKSGAQKATYDVSPSEWKAGEFELAGVKVKRG